MRRVNTKICRSNYRLQLWKVQSYFFWVFVLIRMFFSIINIKYTNLSKIFFTQKPYLMHLYLLLNPHYGVPLTASSNPSISSSSSISLLSPLLLVQVLATKSIVTINNKIKKWQKPKKQQISKNTRKRCQPFIFKHVASEAYVEGSGFIPKVEQKLSF